MDMKEYQAVTFIFQMFPSGTGTNPRSNANMIEGNPIHLFIPESQDVIIKNVKAGGWITNAATNNNSLSTAGSGSPFFTVRFHLLQNTGVPKYTIRGRVSYPNGQGIFGLANGSDTIEYICNTQQNIYDINQVAGGIHVSQIGYATNNFVTGQTVFISLTIEYQLFSKC
jgi:hypothetical protein